MAQTLNPKTGQIFDEGAGRVHLRDIYGNPLTQLDGDASQTYLNLLFGDFTAYGAVAAGATVYAGQLDGSVFSRDLFTMRLAMNPTETGVAKVQMASSPDGVNDWSAWVDIITGVTGGTANGIGDWSFDPATVSYGLKYKFQIIETGGVNSGNSRLYAMSRGGA